MTRHRGRLPTVVGIDAGGTHTRAVVARSDGQVLGRAKTTGASPFTSVDLHASCVRTALDDVLAIADHPPLEGVVVGTTGLLADDGNAVRATLAQRLGPSQLVDVVPDVLVNHAAGEYSGTGAVLSVGTGAIAALVAHGRVERQVSGHGWLIGDEGSAVWMGLAALRATMRHLDGRGPETAIASRVIARMSPSRNQDQSTAKQVTLAAMDRPPQQLGQLAPHVLALAGHDPVASEIVDRATDQLKRAVTVLLNDSEPVHRLVFSGSVLLETDLIANRLMRRLRDETPALQVIEGSDGAAGAAVMAFHLIDQPLSAEEHTKLCQPRHHNPATNRKDRLP